MYKNATIQNCLFGLIGFRQTEHPDYPLLSSDLLESKSGLYFQDVHPLITIENIHQVAPAYEYETYQAYNPATTYLKDQIVKYNNNNYTSLQDTNLGNDPEASNSEFWALRQNLSQFLRNIVKSSISEVTNQVFLKKKLNKDTKSVFEDLRLFEGVGGFQNKIIKRGRFCGFEIDLKKHADLSVILRAVGVQIDTSNPEFKLYLYHSSQVEPLQVWTLNVQNPISFRWADLTPNGLLQDFDSVHDSGSFYLGYYENEVIGQVIKKDHDFKTAPCSTCNHYNYYSYGKWSKYIKVHPFAVDETYLNDDGSLWDVSKNTYDYTQNFGMNLQLSVQCDVSNFICRNQEVFIDAIKKQVAVDILKKIAFTTRNNAISEKTRQLALFELDNRDNYTPGLVKQLDNSIKALCNDLEDFNSLCLPCERKQGVRYVAI